MLAYVDASFLFSFYLIDKHSTHVASFLKTSPEIVVTELAEFEFMQALRLQMFQHDHQHTVGLSRDVGQTALNQFDQDLEMGLFQRQSCNWPDVFKRANALSADHTREGGHRSMDLLHLATAKELRIPAFLTFDNKQQALAKILGFETGMT